MHELMGVHRWLDLVELDGMNEWIDLCGWLDLIE